MEYFIAATLHYYYIVFPVIACMSATAFTLHVTYSLYICESLLIVMSCQMLSRQASLTQLLNKMKACYIKCMKSFFTYGCRDSVTEILGLPF